MANENDNIIEKDITLLADTRKKDEYSTEEIATINRCVDKIKLIGDLFCKGNLLSYRLAGDSS